MTKGHSIDASNNVNEDYDQLASRNTNSTKHNTVVPTKVVQNEMQSPERMESENSEYDDHVNVEDFEKKVDFSRQNVVVKRENSEDFENDDTTSLFTNEQDTDNLFSIQEEDEDYHHYKHEEKRTENESITEENEEDSNESDENEDDNSEEESNSNLSKSHDKSKEETKRSRLSKNPDETAENEAEKIDEKDDFLPEVEKNHDTQEEDHDHDNFDMDDIIDFEKETVSTSKIRDDPRYKNTKCILFPDDAFRNFWDILLALALAYTCVITPYKVAYLSNEDETITWNVLDYTIDTIFGLDIIFNFFSAYYDINDVLITNKKKIALNYFSGIYPFNLHFASDTRYSNLARVARIQRLYKLLRMTKFLRVLKIVKERNKFMKYLTELLRIGPGFERLFISLFSIFIFCHILACFWYMAADLTYNHTSWTFRFNYNDKPNFDIYIASFYWVTQTVVTVGYGDINAGNTLERSISCFLMFVGVFFYSFTIGSLSSLLSTMDSKNASFEQKMNTLVQIRKDHHLNDVLYNRVKSDEEKIKFLDNLPLNLRIELSVIMHKSLVSGIEFFKKKPKRFIAFIGPYLKLIKIGKDEYVFTEGEYADEMYFIKSGQVSMVLKDYGNFQFMTITQGYYFGEVDIFSGETRKYTYMADEDCEILSLHKKHFKKLFFNEFREIGSEIYKNAIKRRIRSAQVYKEALAYCEKERADQIAKEKGQKISIKKPYKFRPQLSFAQKKNSSSLMESDLDKFQFNENKINLIPTNNETEKIADDSNKIENSPQIKITPQEENNPSETLPQENPMSNLNNLNPKKNSKGRLEKLSNMFASSHFFSNLELSPEDKDNQKETETKIKDINTKVQTMEETMEQIFGLYENLGIKTKEGKEESKKQLRKSITLKRKNSPEEKKNNPFEMKLKTKSSKKFNNENRTEKDSETNRSDASELDIKKHKIRKSFIINPTHNENNTKINANPVSLFSAISQAIQETNAEEKKNE